MHNTHLQRGMLLAQQGRHQEAVGELRLSLVQDTEESLTHGLLAMSLAELEQFDEATEHAHRSIHLAPDESFGHYSLARVMLDRRRIDEARMAILEAIRLDPYNANYFGILASLELQKSRWREALEAANQGLEIEPEHALCTNLRATALVKLGDRAGAAATMGEALARRPDDAYTHANQGWALLHAGQPRQAAEHFREALRLDPEMEWARAGIVEALKARNFIYRWMLAWFLWMNRFSPSTRWAIVVGGYLGQQGVRQAASSMPAAAPYLNVVLYAYLAFCLLTWLSPSFFNLLLRLDRFGRYVLSREQIIGANILAGCVVAAAALLAVSLALDNFLLFFAALMAALLSLPASRIYECDQGWPRQAMAGITLVLLAGVVLLICASPFPIEKMPILLLFPVAGTVVALPWAMVGSQFAAMYLMHQTTRR